MEVYMSRKFQQKNKDLVNLEVVEATKIWKKEKDKYVIDIQNYDVFGKVEKGSSTFIVETNKFGDKTKFVEDTCKLPKVAKNKIVDMFNNKNKRVVYLVKKRGK